MRKIVGIAAFGLALAWSGGAMATCQCACIDEKVEEICTAAVDSHHVCAARVCPLTPATLAPIEPARIAPHGMTTCRMAQVYDDKTRKYEWQRVCR